MENTNRPTWAELVNLGDNEPEVTTVKDNYLRSYEQQEDLIEEPRKRKTSLFEFFMPRRKPDHPRDYLL